MRTTIFFGVMFVAVLRLAGYITEPRLRAADIHRILGAPDDIHADAANRQPLKVITWNIERGVNFDKIVSTLERLNADVILLQEVDRYCLRSHRRDVARELAGELRMNWVWAGEFQEIGEAQRRVPAMTGQAVLSRYPIRDASAIVFRDQTWFRWHFSPVQPRRGDRIALKVRTGGMLMYDLHVESGGTDDLRQRQIDDVLDDAVREPDARVVIGGDFNTSADARPLLVRRFVKEDLVDALGVADGRRTSVHHDYPLDWLFVKGANSSGSVEPVSNISDHYPLMASLTDLD
jgi:endonuclease/exonuclease/phosphatase family metal-dependent hydrolase